MKKLPLLLAVVAFIASPALADGPLKGIIENFNPSTRMGNLMAQTNPQRDMQFVLGPNVNALQLWAQDEVLIELKNIPGIAEKVAVVGALVGRKGVATVMDYNAGAKAGHLIDRKGMSFPFNYTGPESVQVGDQINYAMTRDMEKKTLNYTGTGMSETAAAIAKKPGKHGIVMTVAPKMILIKQIGGPDTMRLMGNDLSGWNVQAGWVVGYAKDEKGGLHLLAVEAK
jgi:hypothetical protein